MFPKTEFPKTKYLEMLAIGFGVLVTAPSLQDSFVFKINLMFPFKLLVQAGKYHMNILTKSLYLARS